MQQSMPYAQAAKMVSDYVATSLTGAKVILFTNDIEIGPGTVAAALDEPVGDWYAREDAVPGEPYHTDDQSISIKCGSVQFDYTGTDPSEVIVGCAVVTVAAGPPEVLTLRFANKLPAGVSMGGVLDSVIVAPELTVPVITGQ